MRVRILLGSLFKDLSLVEIDFQGFFYAQNALGYSNEQDFYTTFSQCRKEDILRNLLIKIKNTMNRLITE